MNSLALLKFARRDAKAQSSAEKFKASGFHGMASGSVRYTLKYHRMLSNVCGARYIRCNKIIQQMSCVLYLMSYVQTIN